MLTVVMTSMPASSSSSTSCQRFSCRLPGMFVWASSSTSATAGLRASTASRSISSNVVPAVVQPRAAAPPRARRAARRCARARGSRRTRRRRRCRGSAGVGPRRAWRRSCPPRGPSQVDPQTPTAHAPILRPRVSPVTLPRARARGSARARSTRGSPRNPSVRPCVWSSTRRWTSAALEPARPGDPGDLEVGVRRADVGIEPGAAGGDRVGGDPRSGRRRSPSRRGRAASCDRVEQLRSSSDRGSVAARGQARRTADAEGREWNHSAARELLADQRRADVPPSARTIGAVGLVVEGAPGPRRSSAAGSRARRPP